MDDEQHHPQTPEGASPAGGPRDEFMPVAAPSVAALLAIFVGGAIGTVARYLLDAHHPVAQGNFPWVTLVINLSGSLASGLLIPLTERMAQRAPLARPFLVIGFLGGWTTYSTLAVESTLLAKDGDIATFLAYLAATVIGGLLLVMAGSAWGRRMLTR
ncbi:MAG TPA: CrcB family protein [Acidimicrobiales bacterium]|jgi:CrcB protein|nr:CrcB family protein [Acidimicrobiales bacterium]